MSYRDDVNAVYERAAALQREVDRLKAELEARPSVIEEVEQFKAGLQGRPSVVDEIERFEAELDPRSAPPPATTVVPSHMRERTPPVWLPLSQRANAPWAPAQVDQPSSEARELLERLALPEERRAREGREPLFFGPTPDEELGLLVARLSASEHSLVRRLLHLLTEDDFSGDAVRRNLRALDRLAAELRAHLAAVSHGSIGQ